MIKHFPKADIKVFGCCQILLNFFAFHCVKSVLIRSYSGPYIPTFGLNTERYGEIRRDKLSKEVFVNNHDGLQRFCDISINVLNRHAPHKRKHARRNQMPLITKDLSKAIMKRSRLHNNFLKNRTGENKTLYTKQRNYCVSLLKRSKKKYFANLNEKDILDNKLFWKTIKSALPDKDKFTRDRIDLSEKGESVKTKLEIGEVLNKFFSNVVNNLEISKYYKYESFIGNIGDETLRAILKHKNHPSIIAIQNKCKGGDVFFSENSKKRKFKNKIQKEIHKLNNNKASQHFAIPTKIIKSNSDIFSDFLYVSINSSIKSSLFPSCLKTADTTPIYKKGKKRLERQL